MARLPNQCPHIMVDGANCGSPAMRRNRFCYFHKRLHEERLALSTDRARNSHSRPFTLPPLEDANTIQISLTEVMNLLLAGEIEHKTASLCSTPCRSPRRTCSRLD